MHLFSDIQLWSEIRESEVDSDVFEFVYILYILMRDT